MESQSQTRQSQLEPWIRFENKVVLVTGASSGIGRELCLDLVKAGCKIIAAARRADRLESVCHVINQHACTIRAQAVELDVTAGGSAIEEAVGKAWNAFGTIDVLVNNAGFRGPVKSMLDLTDDEWDTTTKTNMRGLWLVTKYTCLLMRGAKKGGSIINISSVAGINRTDTASKTGVIGITKAMAIELGPHNIRVNSISPGLFKTEITENLMNKDWLKDVVRKLIPLRDISTVDPALTSLLRFLIHDSSQFITGNNFIADAGVILPGVPIFSTL